MALYGLSPRRVTVLQDERHLVFGVWAGRAMARFVLRVYRDGRPDRAVTRSQLQWLRAIRRDTDLVVPEPVANVAGDYVTPLRIDGVAVGPYCTLTRWVEGERRFRRNGPGVGAMRGVGWLMATLHLHGQGFRPPSRFRCPRWDYEGLFGGSSPWRPVHPGRIEPATRRLFRDVMRMTRDAMERLGTAVDTFGLIHGDLMQANYIFHRGQARAIDFGDAGHGYFLYDMAVTLLMLRPFDRDGRQAAAFLRGYGEVKSLPPEYASLLDTFIAARAVVLARWIAGAASPSSGDLQWVSDTTAWLARWYDGDGRKPVARSV